MKGVHMKKIKHLLLIGLLCGCSADYDGPKPVMPQNDPVAPKEETSELLDSSFEQIHSNTEKQPTDDSEDLDNIDSIIEKYYQTIAEEELLELDEELLKISLRVGEIDDEEFRKKKSELDVLDDELDQLEDKLEQQLKTASWNLSINDEFKQQIQNSSMDECLSLYDELQSADDALESEEENLKAQYLNGEISRDDALLKWVELEKQSDLYDEQEDFLEDYLEAMGFDD